MSKLTYFPLPSYTSERFYLLSELEQRAKFGLSDEDVGNYLTATSRFCYLYGLWDLGRTSVAEFKEYLDALLRLHAEVRSNVSSILSIEVLLSKEKWGSDCEDEKAIFSVHRWVLQHYPQLIKNVVFGISDKVSGTPALEAILDCILTQEKGCVSTPSPGIHVLIAPARDTFLGHDSTREPDAESGVFQALLYNLEKEISWVGKKKATSGPDITETTLSVSGNEAFAKLQFRVRVASLCIALVAIFSYNFLHP